MIDQDKSKQALIEELVEMRRRIAVLEGIDADRKRAEEALGEREERFKLFMDNSPAIAWMKDELGRYVYFSKSYEKRIGIQLEDSCGKTDFDLWPGETAEHFWKNDQAVLASGQAVELIEESSVPNDGHCYWWNVKFPLQDSVGRRFVGGVGIDITECKRAEAALQKAHDELERRVKERTAELAKANENLDIFRRFAEDSGEGFGMSDFDGRIIYANSTLCRLYGEEKPEDVVGKHVSAYYPAEYMQLRKEKLIPALLQHGHWHIEQTALPRDGKPIQILQSTFLIRDNDGSPFRIAVVISDITERKRTEEALQRERQSLWHMLQASDHERQIISYEIHDGLAQYLAAAGMQLQVYESLKESVPEEAEKSYETAKELVRQAHAESRRLINDVRPPVIDETGLETAISHLIHEQRNRGGPNITFNSDVQFGKLQPILENAFYRIAQEALTNSCKHSKSKKVSVTLVQEGQDVCLEVRDWGIGFDAVSVKTGQFGLEGIRQRVRLLGGRLTIESTPGSGTLIRVVVPILEKVTEPRPENGKEIQ